MSSFIRLINQSNCLLKSGASLPIASIAALTSPGALLYSFLKKSDHLIFHIFLIGFVGTTIVYFSGLESIETLNGVKRKRTEYILYDDDALTSAENNSAKALECLSKACRSFWKLNSFSLLNSQRNTDFMHEKEFGSAFLYCILVKGSWVKERRSERKRAIKHTNFFFTNSLFFHEIDVIRNRIIWNAINRKVREYRNLIGNPPIIPNNPE